MDSDLFGNSLGRKSTPKPVAKATQNKPKTTETSSGVQQGKINERKPAKDDATSKPETRTSTPGRKFDISKYDSMGKLSCNYYAMKLVHDFFDLFIQSLMRMILLLVCCLMMKIMVLKARKQRRNNQSKRNQRQNQNYQVFENA